MTPSLVRRFLDAVGEEKIFYIEGDYLPVFLVVDWFNGTDGDGNLQNVYPFLCYRKDGKLKGYWSLDRYQGIAKELAGRYLYGTLDVAEYMRTYEACAARIDSAYESYFRLRSSRDEEAMLAALHEAHRELHLLANHTLALDAVEESVIASAIQDRGMEVDMEKVLRVSHIPSFPSFEVKNCEAILAAQGMGGEEALQYVFSNYTQVSSFEDTKDLVAAADAEKLRREIKERKEEVAAHAAERARLAASLSEDEKRVLSFIDWSGQLRDDRKALLTKCDVLIHDLIRDLYMLWSIPEELVPVSLVYEVLKGRAFIESREAALRARLTRMAVLYTGEDRYLEQEDFPEEEIAFLDEMHLRQNLSEDTSRVKGEIASKGIVRAVARVITSKDEFGKLGEGEVLVTGMTRPEYVPLMKRASAIVTDEGGITSHAAIVSRELRKPCIIGTRIATRLIHDGDTVEVNGDTGIVTILTRHG